ncbi:MAG: hypothetical protein V9E98_06650 [Candidatus Nanopelagicales bacterium]
MRPGTAAFADFLNHCAGDHVAGGEVLDGGGVALHEAFTRRVAQDAAFAAGTFGQEHAEAGQAGGVELVELHVLQGEAAAVGDGHAVAGERVGVGRGLEDLAEPAGGEDDALGLERVDLAGGQFVGDDTDARVLRDSNTSRT